MRSRAASMSRDPRAGPYTLGQGLGPDPAFEWTPGGRLSLVTATAVGADTTGAGTGYYTEHVHSVVPLWDGRKVRPYELPVRPGTTAREVAISFAGVASATVYDVFLRPCGRSVEGFVGPAWSSATARATAGTLVRVGGRRVLRSDPRCLWIGTVYGSGSGTVDDSGAAGQRYLYNAFNRVRREFKAIQSSSWTYTSATIRAANSNTTNGAGRVSMVIGASDEPVECFNIGYGFNSGGAVQALAGIGLDRTNGDDTSVRGGALLGGGAAAVIAGRFYGQIGIGFHYLQSVEACSPSGTSTWHGASSPYIQAGLCGSVFA